MELETQNACSECEFCIFCDDYGSAAQISTCEKYQARVAVKTKIHTTCGNKDYDCDQCPDRRTDGLCASVSGSKKIMNDPKEMKFHQELYRRELGDL